MKMSSLGLVALGVVAALGAAILVASLRGPGGNQAKAPAKEVRVCIASKSLELMTLVDSRAVEVRTMPETDAPEQYLSDPVRVVGKVLVMPIVKGQPFSESCFAVEGSGVNLASGLKKGMRAVSLSLSSSAALDGLLYPGSVVDVLATFRPRSDESEAVSIILLERVPVLAVESRTVLTPDSEKQPDKAQRNRRRKVTVMVNPDQAQLLQLAMEYGTLSLAMRKPTDDTSTGAVPVTLRDLAKWISKVKQPGTQPDKQPDKRPDKPPAAERWRTEVIRGSNRNTEMFTAPKGGTWRNVITEFIIM